MITLVLDNKSYGLFHSSWKPAVQRHKVRVILNAMYILKYAMTYVLIIFICKEALYKKTQNPKKHILFIIVTKVFLLFL